MTLPPNNPYCDPPPERVHPSLIAETPFEQELLRLARSLNFRVGKPRILVAVWNGTRLCFYDTSQIY